jgi:hypothetical protein
MINEKMIEKVTREFLRKNFKIQKDYEWGEDGCYTTLFDSEGSEIFSGDYYHDHIDDMIRGFFLALDYLDIEYEVEKININEERDEDE